MRIKILKMWKPPLGAVLRRKAHPTAINPSFWERDTQDEQALHARRTKLESILVFNASSLMKGIGHSLLILKVWA